MAYITYLALVISFPYSILGNPSANSANIDDSLNDNDVANNDDSEDNWFIPQNNPSENVTILINSPKYGFANKISGALTAFEVYYYNILSLVKNLLLILSL